MTVLSGEITTFGVGEDAAFAFGVVLFDLDPPNKKLVRDGVGALDCCVETETGTRLVCEEEGVVLGELLFVDPEAFEATLLGLEDLFIAELLILPPL